MDTATSSSRRTPAAPVVYNLDDSSENEGSFEGDRSSSDEEASIVSSDERDSDFED